MTQAEITEEAKTAGVYVPRMVAATCYACKAPTTAPAEHAACWLCEYCAGVKASYPDGADNPEYRDI